MTISIKNLPTDLTTSWELLEWLRANLGDVNQYDHKTLVDIHTLMQELAIGAAREKFYYFCELMYPEILDEDPAYGRHLEIMAEALQGMFEARKAKRRAGKKVMVNLPPRSSKSLMCSVLFPIWCLGLAPKLKVTVFMANSNLVEKNIGATAKRLMGTQTLKQIFPNLKLSADMKAAGHWGTTEGGWFKGFGRTAGKSGWGGDLLIVDDLISEVEGDSLNPDMLDEINKSFGSGILSRRNPNAMVAVMMTRWAENDICGYLLEHTPAKSPWVHIIFPAYLDERAVELLRRPGDPVDLYTVGGSYWPQLWPREDLEETEAVSSKEKWDAVYMQRPRASKGSIFDESRFRDWDFKDERGKLIPPMIDLYIISVDGATNDDRSIKSSYTAIEVWGLFTREEEDVRGNSFKSHNIILMSARKGKWGLPALLAQLRALSVKYPNNILLVERKSVGISVVQALELEGLPIVGFNPGTDSKTARANAAAPIIDVGRVWVPKSLSFAKEFLDEVIPFPRKPEKDYVDAMTQAILYLRNQFVLKQAAGAAGAIEEQVDPEDRKTSNVIKLKNSHWSRI